MLARLLILAATLTVAPRAAGACINGVEWTVNDYVRVVAKAEKQLEAGRYAAAKKTLGRMRFPTAALQERAADVKAVVALRTQGAKAAEPIAKHFKARSDATKDVRFKAWHAEALIALGQKGEARALLVALKESDLMPDAYALRALAMLSTGTERYELYKQCRRRAKAKAICELPAERITNAKG